MYPQNLGNAKNQIQNLGNLKNQNPKFGESRKSAVPHPSTVASRRRLTLQHSMTRFYLEPKEAGAGLELELHSYTLNYIKYMLPHLGAGLSQTEEGATVLATSWWPRPLRRWELVEKITVTRKTFGRMSRRRAGVGDSQSGNDMLPAAALHL